MISEETKQQILEAYDAGDRLTEIAHRFNVSPSRVSSLAKASGRTLRQRGAKAQEEPSDRVKMILNLAARKSFREVANLLGDEGCSHQNVAEIYNKWSRRLWATNPLFKPGDVIKWYGEEFTILAVYDHEHGRVLTESGAVINDFKWRIGSNRAKLVRSAPAVPQAPL